MAQKRHFKGVGKEKIHTAREGSCKEFNNCDYVKNTPEDADVRHPRQSHHVVPVSTTIGYKPDKDFKGFVPTIDAVYKNTRWCVNQGENMKWLPLKGTYKKRANNTEGGKYKPRGEAKIWSLNLPCHDWDHNCADGYTDEVRAELKAKVWQPIKDAKEDGACPEDKAAVAQFEAVQKKFHAALKGRGRRQGGTKSAIGKEGTGTWWLPFSMAKAATARNRVVRSFGSGPENRPKGLRRAGR